mmetsp:Transcript_14949/g.21905  ORF Transcript_14949/g.21905 Transcript_14949/m.21905 type:complete len:844 (-) Transcript_14949:121-2652(-)
MSNHQGHYYSGDQQHVGYESDERSYNDDYDDGEGHHGGGEEYYEPGQEQESQTYVSGDYTSVPDILQLNHLCANAIAPRSNLEEDRLEADESWEPVREWMRTHNADEVRQAAEQRGESSMTALHFACRNQPPVDVINVFLSIAVDTVQWPDTFGWLPIHYACACGAETDVIKALAEAYPESKTTVDRRGRTPLHFALGNQNPEQLAAPAVVAILSSTGAASYADDNGMLPLHYACAYGASEESLFVLTDAHHDAISTRDRNNRTPLHFALSNAGRKASPGAVRHLLELDNNLANANNGPLPLRVLAEFAHALKRNTTDADRESVRKCLAFLLKATPRPTADFFTALQSLPDWLSEQAVVMTSVQIVLNEKISQRFPTAVLILDFLALAVIIVFYSLNVAESIKVRSKKEDDEMIDITRDLPILLPLYIGAGYFFIREIVQMMSLLSLKAFHLWLNNASNWLNLVFISLVLFWTVSMQIGIVKPETFRIGTALTVSILWLKVLGFLRNMLIDFAVFSGGVFYVFKRLVAFLTALGIILIGFAQMFVTVFQDTETCYNPPDDDEDYWKVYFEREEWEVACEEDNDRTYCTFWTSFLAVYTMLLGEVDEKPFVDDGFATFLFVIFMFLVVILLANVLIAIVTESYKVIQDQRAAIVFWTNRLDFVAEMDAVANGPWKFRLRKMLGIQMDADEHTEVVFGREFWKRLMDLFEDDIDGGAMSAEFWAYNLLRVTTAIIIIPSWVILGMFSAGWLWPPQVREAIFTSTVTQHNSETEREDELRKTQVIKLRGEVAELKEEMGKELKVDRTQVVQMKSLVAERRAEIANEMKHIKRIMTMLFEQQSNLDA